MERDAQKIMRELKNEAAEACANRGHSMKWGKPFRHQWSDAMLQDGTCRTCGAWVQLNSRPQPNGIDIGGEAVALNCPVHAAES